MSRFAEAENDRRISNIAQAGVIEQVDYSNPPRARVRIGELLTGWVRMGTSRAGDAHQSWGYSVGEEVLVVATSGDLAQGVIVCAISNGTNAAQAAAETYRAVYPGGVIIEIAGGSVNITAPGNVVVNGDVIADGISLKTHVHGGIVPGPADTGEPK
ncbi:MAG: phage baseplate assembly protein V [Paenirhodobacter sp.]|uniref:phage baseplate assembly protein V n=1 Tax=Paenirhodobacter sp. TaxID=1965326 RepID=UPI003D1075DD